MVMDSEERYKGKLLGLKLMNYLWITDKLLKVSSILNVTTL